MRKWLSKFKPIVAAVSCWLIAQCLDILTTEFAMAFIPGAEEANPLVRDPFTHKFVLFKGVVVKGIGFVVEGGLLSVCAYIGTKDLKFSSLPLYVMTFGTLSACVNNLAILWLVLR